VGPLAASFRGPSAARAGALRRQSRGRGPTAAGPVPGESLGADHTVRRSRVRVVVSA
jgi:hypothetical protein